MNSISSDHSLDAQLLQKIAEGCRHSFNTLYEKYWENTYASVYKRLKDADLAKDLVQEIFTHIWFKRETLQIDNLPAYLHVAARNRVFKQVAREKLTHPFFDVLETLPSLYQQTDSDLLAKEFFKAYESLVNTLPAKKQRIFRLRFEEDLSTKDIAGQLGLSRKTVQNQLTNAVAYLKTALFFLLIFILILHFNKG
jgi:RNA polymerase sigma-70 factor (ECF subfamily)